MLERIEMVLEQHLGIGDGVLRAHEDERHRPLLPRHRGRRLVVALDLDPDDPALVDDFLDEATVLADDFADERPRNLKIEIRRVFYSGVTLLSRSFFVKSKRQVNVIHYFISLLLL